MTLKTHAIALTTLMLAMQPMLGQAQWSNDPTQYIAITEKSDAGQIVTDNQGNIIIGYSDPSTRYDFILKKYDNKGNPLWNNEPVLIRDRNQSFIFTWAIDIGPNNEVYTSIEDLTTRELIVTKTATDGSPAWTEPFIPQPDDMLSGLTANLAPSEHGLAYSFMYVNADREQLINVGLLNDDGEQQWSATLSNITRTNTHLDIIAVKDGIVVLTYGPRESDNSNALYIQKYNYQGKPLWGENAKLIMFGDIALPFRGNNIIKMHDDGNGGVAFAWRQPTLFGANLYLQHINQDGEPLFDNSGLRVSHNANSQYNDVNIPTMLFNDDTMIVTWVGLGRGGPFRSSALFMQQVQLDGQFVNSSDPTIILEIERSEEDLGYLSGGFISQYNDQLSLLYADSENNSGNITNIRRVDFNLDGNVLRNNLFAETNAPIGRVSPARSPFGELVSTFKTGYVSSSPTYIQSMQVNGELGYNSELTLEWPQVPWVIDEDQPFTTKLQIKNNAQVELELTATTEVEDTEIAVNLDDDNAINLSLVPAVEFAGNIPVAITVTNKNDPNQKTQLTYNIRVNSINDSPIITLTENMNVNESETITITPEISDPDSAHLDIEWVQLNGESLDFDPFATELVFNSPVVIAEQQAEFSLSVRDEHSTTNHNLKINILDDKSITLSNQTSTVTEAESLSLAPALSNAKLPITAKWQQTSGPQLTLSTTNDLDTTITAPFVEQDSVAVLTLDVTDALGQTISQNYQVNINDYREPDSGGSLNWSLLLLALVAIFRKKHTTSSTTITE